jgi:hypothetical protein
MVLPWPIDRSANKRGQRVLDNLALRVTTPDPSQIGECGFWMGSGVTLMFWQSKKLVFTDQR